MKKNVLYRFVKAFNRFEKKTGDFTFLMDMVYTVVHYFSKYFKIINK